MNQKYARFYDRPEWKELRYRVLIKFGSRCLLCGTSGPGVVIQVDHIRPISIYPELALTESNLQPLCRECNLGKSNHFEHDFRPARSARVYPMREQSELVKLQASILSELAQPGVPPEKEAKLLRIVQFIGIERHSGTSEETLTQAVRDLIAAQLGEDSA
jgi:hypothetical protein